MTKRVFQMGSIRPPILGDPGAVSRAEERRDENFQARAEEPLGTDSQRTISKRSSKCWLLIGHKKCFVLLCPIGEEFLLSSESPSLFMQGKLSFSTFLTRNEGTTDESKKRFGCHQQEQSNLHKKVKKAIAWHGKTR